jgi:hypothetical protein
MSAQEQKLHSRFPILERTSTRVAGESKSPSASIKRYPYRYLAPLITFLASTLFAANGKLQLGWVLGHIVGYATNAIFLFYILITRDPLITNLFVFGLVTGFGTLVSDCYQVKNNILFYPREGPFWACSPEYMFWCSCPYMVQMGAIAYYLLYSRSYSVWKACFITGLVGAVLISTIEFQANSAQGWSYGNVPMVYKHLPWYIVLLQIPICGIVPWHVHNIVKYTDSKHITVRNLLLSAGMGAIQAITFPVVTIAALETVNCVFRLADK